MPFSASSIFYFTSSIKIPFEDFLHPGKKKVFWGEIGWIGRVGHGSLAIFDQKLLDPQHGAERCTHKSSIVKWTNAVSLEKKFTEAYSTQPLTTPASTLIQMGSQTTQLVREACSTRWSPSRRLFWVLGVPLHNRLPSVCHAAWEVEPSPWRRKKRYMYACCTQHQNERLEVTCPSVVLMKDSELYPSH